MMVVVSISSSEQRGAGAWAPLRVQQFRAMWSAQFISNIGGWMQTVGAQWLMLSLTTSTTALALVQTASSLPVLLFAIPAGAVGDLVDRRRFLLFAQLAMLAAAVLLGALSLAGAVTPLLLLALLFAVGTGQAWTSPTWQTLQPELVGPEQRPQAIALGSVNQNLARAIGPAIGGVLLAATSAGTVFLVNAATFLAVVVVVARWRPAARAARASARTAAAPEHVGGAVRAGARYVANSPALRAILLRAGLFVFFASSIWALLPVVARGSLGLGSGGYGLLLGCVGIGAVAGATLLPRLRAGHKPDVLLVGSSLVVAALALVMAFVHTTVVVAIALAIGGAAWILALSTLNAAYQSTLPSWVKARGMGFYLVVFQGGNAIGSAVLGITAEATSVKTTLAIAAAGLVLGPLVALRVRLRPIAPEELVPAATWPPPSPVTDDARVPAGPVMVSITYTLIDGADHAAFARALRGMRFARRRTGATSWRMWADAADPDRYAEQFVVGSWEEHARQHERVSRRDQQRLDAVFALTDPAHPPVVEHWLSPAET
jgi:MFS family permease